MDADWSVELADDDPVLDFPWSTDEALAYVDVKRHPEKLNEIPEVRDLPELADFLRVINQPGSSLLTAKCDTWIDHELNEWEKIYDAKRKFCSYVDLLFDQDDARFSFPRYEQFVKSLAGALSHSDDSETENLAAAAEFIVRRCWYHSEETPCTEPSPRLSAQVNAVVPDARAGFYITFYLSGYGVDEAEARSLWAAGLKRATRVLARFAA